MEIDIYEVFSNDDCMGFSIRWRKEDTGVGLLTVMKFWKNGRIVIDDEYMGKEFAEKIFNALVEKGNLKSEC